MISKQPNGLYCRISRVVDAPTFENVSKTELENYLIGTNQLAANQPIDEWLEKYMIPFDTAVQYIGTLNMDREMIDDWISKVSNP